MRETWFRWNERDEDALSIWLISHIDTPTIYTSTDLEKSKKKKISYYGASGVSRLTDSLYPIMEEVWKGRVDDICYYQGEGTFSV